MKDYNNHYLLNTKHITNKNGDKENKSKSFP